MGFTTAGGVHVSMLTDNRDGTVTVRMHPNSPMAPEVKLREPTAYEYATLRVKMTDVDREMEEAVNAPTMPILPDDTPTAEAAAAVQQFQKDATAAVQRRRDLTRDPEKAPYAHVIMDVIETLGPRRPSMDDLPVEAFMAATCSALLEVWEGPLGGRDEEPPAANAVEETPPPATEPGSPESEPS